MKSSNFYKKIAMSESQARQTNIGIRLPELFIERLNFAKSFLTALFILGIICQATAQVPAAPTLLTATKVTGSGTQVQLTWRDNSSNETAFVIERMLPPGQYAEIARTAANVSSYINNWLTENTTYSYRVRAYGPDGYSAYSNPAAITTGTVTTAPAAPSNLSAVAASCTTATLTWSDNSGNEDQFLIEKQIGTGSFVSLGAVGLNVTTFTVTGLTSGTNYTFRIRTMNKGGYSAYCPSALLNIQPVQITSQPQPANITQCQNTSVNFSIGATGTGITYQWRKNGVNIDGATSLTYSIQSISGNGPVTRSFDVVVTGVCNSILSQPAILTVLRKPNISGGSNKTTYDGDNVYVTFTSDVTGDGLIYQWRKDGINIMNANSNSYTIENFTVADIGNYDLLITGTCGSTTSQIFNLPPCSIPIIKNQPVSLIQPSNSVATFNVGATGINNTYIWRKNGINISGAISSSYSINGITTADAGDYDVIVVCRGHRVTSSVAHLTVLDFPLPQITLNHKFDSYTPGATTITVDANNLTNLACRDNMGYANHLLSWENDSKSYYNWLGNWIISDVCLNSLSSLHIPMSRIYAIYDEPLGLHKGLDRLAHVCDVTNVPQNKMIICIEVDKALVPADILDPTIYADAVSYCLSKGYNFKYWEISNEPYLSKDTQLHDALVYAQHVRDCYDAIKTIDPNAIVGCHIDRTSPWNDQVLTGIAGKADFITGHWYGYTNFDQYSPTENILTENYKDLTFIAFENDNINHRIGRSIPQIDTEWRLYGNSQSDTNRDLNNKNGNIIGALYNAVRMIYSIRDNFTFGANCWSTLGVLPGALVPGGSDAKYGVPDPLDGKTSYLYWVYKFFIQYTGEDVVAFGGSAPGFTGNAYNNTDDNFDPKPDLVYTGPLTPLMVTKSSDGTKLYITVVNGSGPDSDPIPFSATVSNFTALSQTAYRISDNDYNKTWYQDNNSSFVSNPTVTKIDNVYTCSLPPMSVTFIVLDASGTQQSIQSKMAGNEMEPTNISASLGQCVPNPFNQTTEIGYYLPETAKVCILNIYNTLGQLVKSIPVYQKGQGTITIDGSSLNAGIQYYTLIVDGQKVASRIMSVIK